MCHDASCLDASSIPKGECHGVLLCACLLRCTTEDRDDRLPVAITGAGSVGLAAAAQPLARGLRPVLIEAGPDVGTSVRAWGHVRMFSPWRSNIDKAAGALLAHAGWHPPDPEALPTGNDLVDRYLRPLASSCSQG